ncbi:MAG: DUF1343 domain-containing protein, partial [Burkholderiales bacterium]|nr:DUF1343 domain-containing protein [Burkholderiales bacterium]
MRIFIILFTFLSSLALANPIQIQAAAYKTESYFPLIKNKKIAIFANNASVVDNENIVTFLKKNNINIVKIFSPEHGFTGTADAGDKVSNSNVDGIPIISLYGKKEAPDAKDLSDVDVVIFDIQDVGVRYYTYISSLQKLMEVLTLNNKPLIILDRPNPNAYYIDGPVLDKKYKSFIGMQSIPVVYGMTIGEYALMLKGEQWLDLKPKSLASKLNLTIITIDNYTHQDVYAPSVRPSPNLPNLNSIYWYPSLGFFEGTKLSIGRGTNFPFQVIGSPYLKQTEFSFTPKSMFGSQKPPLNNQICYGWDLQMDSTIAKQQIDGQIQLKFLIQSYKQYESKEAFFTD